MNFFFNQTFLLAKPFLISYKPYNNFVLDFVVEI